MKSLILNTGTEVLLDDEDYNYFSQWCWYEGRDGYAYRTLSYNPNKKSCLHLEIAKRMSIWAAHLDIDHKDRNKQNCQRSNLRAGTKSQNAGNVDKRTIPTSSKYKGVYYDQDRSKWVAQIKRQKNVFYLGSFESEVEAARAYNNAAPRVFGEFACLNVIGE